MRTTVTLDDELLRKAKRAAVESGSTLSELIEESLIASLAARGGTRKEIPPLPTFRGEGKPRVDLSDNAAVREFELEWEIRDRPERFPWLRREEK